ncbi:hypothetical protein [Terriglobus saanensis]|uniref:PBP domain-containing protein n=1 Tax=Terriglobus saanensis (strain ATCC BAA-1853 / DSM 23119 / SP1PR4) TaxID=401053 RepID=E8V078_TERSS|nr:hypothetical protein [Terriglobus saanensis]ADV83296.1 hypothetical protein AciPR4_2517 [Terriglobus saanensis SP1PR4]
MKQLLKVSLAFGAALTALSANAQTPAVQINGLGSSALFLETGLAASSTSSGLGGTCVWSSTGSTAGSIAVATDTSTGGSLTDSGQSWVAWTPSSLPASATTCSDANVTSATKVWAYLQTDSVVGDRCLFNANKTTGAQCSIAYPTAGVAPANLILPAGSEFALPPKVATALSNSVVNAAGTDIRPEDAAFAAARSTFPGGCGTAMGTGANAQYLGLGYNNGDNISSFFSTSTFHVVNFTLPSVYSVTPIGATPILVVVNGDSTGFNNPSSPVNNISSDALAKFLDGRNSFTGQALATPVASGAAVTALIREPLSGTYNTMEFNVPNTTVEQTSQDVGLNQPATQRDCNPVGVGLNPMNIMTASGGHRRRAIGTGQELSEVLDTTNNGTNTLGYGFWSVANFKGFTSALAPNAKYLTVDTIDPLLTNSATHTGVIPTTGSADLAHVTLSHVQDGTYPIWSLLRLVTVDTTATANAVALSNAAQAFVSSGTSTSRPDFVTANRLTVVRSHFLPPATGVGEPPLASIANGHVGNITSSNCTAPEAGGDVGGQVFTLAADSTFCSTNGPNGETEHRR